jgi:ubiquinone/menaquinone biosynthesis C-methylase UbiE
MLTDLFPVTEDGYMLISESRSFGLTDDLSAEDEYAKQFNVDDTYTQNLTKGLRYLLPKKKYGHIIEIGCGTGILSRALALSIDSDELVISDSSQKFLSMTKRRIGDVREGVSYAILNGDDIGRIPDGYFSVAAFRYLLHHVLDWKSFLCNISKKISPNGCIVFEEPCVEGFLLQILAAALCKVDSTDPTTTKNLDNFVKTIMWYLRTEVDKTKSEDKHLFQQDEIFSLFNDLGFLGKFYPNVGINDVYSEGTSSKFIPEFRHNLKGNFGFSDRTIEWFDKIVAPKISFIEEITKNSPRVKGIFKFTRA